MKKEFKTFKRIINLLEESNCYLSNRRVYNNREIKTIEFHVYMRTFGSKSKLIDIALFDRLEILCYDGIRFYFRDSEKPNLQIKESEAFKEINTTLVRLNLTWSEFENIIKQKIIEEQTKLIGEI